MSRLSLSMIVRNEREGLARCVGSVAGLVDEVVIVDTGSTDGTWAMVQDMANIHKQIEWPDHFAQARNESLALATGDWVLVLDGDEELVGGHDAIRHAMTRSNLLGAELQIRNLMEDGRTADFWALRLFRREPNVAFSGRIHEQVMPSLRRIMAESGPQARRIGRIEAQILHWGYLPESNPQKDRKTRNVSMLRTALLESSSTDTLTTRAYLEYKLAKELGVGTKEGRIHLEAAGRRVLSMSKAVRANFSLAAEILVAVSQIWLLHGSGEDALRSAEVAAECLPLNPMVSLVRAQAHDKLGHIDAAKRAAIVARTQQGSNSEFFFDPIAFDLALSKLEADIAMQRGETEAALSILCSLVDRQPGNAQAELWIVEGHLDAGKPEAALRSGLVWLKQNGSHPACLRLCARAAEALGMRDRAQRWRELAGQQ